MIRRRTLVSSPSWVAPAILVSVSAPSYAASACANPVTQDIEFVSVTYATDVCTAGGSSPTDTAYPTRNAQCFLVGDSQATTVGIPIADSWNTILTDNQLPIFPAGTVLTLTYQVRRYMDPATSPEITSVDLAGFSSSMDSADVSVSAGSPTWTVEGNSPLQGLDVNTGETVFPDGSPGVPYHYLVTVPITITTMRDIYVGEDLSGTIAIDGLIYNGTARSLSELDPNYTVPQYEAVFDEATGEVTFVEVGTTSPQGSTSTALTNAPPYTYTYTVLDQARADYCTTYTGTYPSGINISPS